MEAPNTKTRLPETYRPVATSTVRDVVIVGGAEAAKTYSVAIILIMRALQVADRRIIIIRKHQPSLKRTCWWIITKLLADASVPCKVHYTDMTITFPNGSEMLFIPMVTSKGEPGERLKSITDIDDIWFEECTELSEGEWKQAKLRHRGSKTVEVPRQRFYTCNPIGIGSWVYKQFFDVLRKVNLDPAKMETFRFTWRDNPFVDQESIDELEATKDEDSTFYKIFGLGLWAELKNQIYPPGSKRGEVSTEDFKYEPDFYDEIIAGVDFGHDTPSAFVLIGLKNQTAYVIDEIYERKLLTWQFTERIKSVLSDHFVGNGPPIYCDSAEPGRIEEMQQAGLSVFPAKKNVLDGINRVKAFHITIHDRCEHSKKELLAYHRKEDVNGGVLPEPVKVMDHTVDALRYGLYTHTMSGTTQAVSNVALTWGRIRKRADLML